MKTGQKVLRGSLFHTSGVHSAEKCTGKQRASRHRGNPRRHPPKGEMGLRAVDAGQAKARAFVTKGSGVGISPRVRKGVVSSRVCKETSAAGGCGQGFRR